jgi:hypothetical protein
MKSTNAILSGYDSGGRPLTGAPKRLTKRARKKLFGKGPGGNPGPGRKEMRKAYSIQRSAAYLKTLAKKRRDK